MAYLPGMTTPPELPASDVSIPNETVDRAMRERVAALCLVGWAIWDRFSAHSMERPFHPFVAADYDEVCRALWPYRGRGLRFLEWGSATGVITIMADLLGMDACGIELDSGLMTTAHTLAEQFDSDAQFALGSFLPTGYQWRARDGDQRTGTLGSGPSGYLQLGHALDEFDIVFGFPWDGEASTMLDVMQRYGRPDALLLIYSASDGIRSYRDGRVVANGS